MESFDELRYPDREMLGQHALFDPAVIEVPMLNPVAFTQNPSKLKIKRLNEITTITYPSSPNTTVGWKGALSAQKLNVRDIRPVLSDRYHLLPSSHTTFVGSQFVVCTFLPRPLENGDPEAMKVPFYHSGQFFSREGISSGMLTFHPRGIHHVPQPKAVERSKELKSSSEAAVMLDTKNPLVPAATAETCENKNYWKSRKTEK
jgi:homogentisate 1,2-dioxygenase